MLALKTSGRNPCLPLSASSDPRHSLACGNVTPISTSIFTGSPSFCVLLSLLRHHSLNLGPHVNWEWSHLELLNELHLQRASFQIRSPSEISGRSQFWGDKIQLIILYQTLWPNFLITSNNLWIYLCGLLCYHETGNFLILSLLVIFPLLGLRTFATTPGKHWVKVVVTNFFLTSVNSSKILQVSIMYWI